MKNQVARPGVISIAKKSFEFGSGNAECGIKEIRLQHRARGMGHGVLSERVNRG